jgi:hypothetical protein
MCRSGSAMGGFFRGVTKTRGDPITPTGEALWGTRSAKAGGGGWLLLFIYSDKVQAGSGRGAWSQEFA